MAKAKNKTVETDGSVMDFINSVDHEKRKEDAKKVLSMLKDITGSPAKMWGNSLIGFGNYHYKYESGREGDFFKAGLSPRKTALTIYIMAGFERFEELMAKLGKYKTGKSCLYIKKLEDVDEEVLKELMQASYDYMTNKYG